MAASAGTQRMLRSWKWICVVLWLGISAVLVFSGPSTLIFVNGGPGSVAIVLDSTGRQIPVGLYRGEVEPTGSSRYGQVDFTVQFTPGPRRWPFPNYTFLNFELTSRRYPMPLKSLTAPLPIDISDAELLRRYAPNPKSGWFEVAGALDGLTPTRTFQSSYDFAQWKGSFIQWPLLTWAVLRVTWPVVSVIVFVIWFSRWFKRHNRMLERACPKCGYPLVGVPTGDTTRCPECGSETGFFKL